LFLNFIHRWQNWLMALFLLMLACTGIRLYPHTHLSHNMLFSTTVYDVNGELLRLTLAKDEKYRLWTPLQEMPPSLIQGVQLYEDQWFYYHFGFNPISLLRATIKSYGGSGATRQGGSTITMQLARMYWKLNTKTVYGKFIQILRAIQLELSYSKNDILEAYLNYAPYGRNIESIGAASLIYFDKQPLNLNLQEALTLAVLPQSPSYRIDKNTGIVEKGLQEARNRLFASWRKIYPTSSFDAALFKLPLALKQPEQLPFIAPHFVDRLLYERHYYAKETREIHTSLDSRLQELLETQMHSFIQRNAIKGIFNASAILVDTRTMHIKALVGSANYHDTSIYGQVDGTRAKRSPGSTLKPFIYALGFDQGLIHPMSILKDVPSSFGIYTPENFDLKFQGPITVSDALIYSRNIPAVSIASKLTQPNLYQFLQYAGIEKMATEEHYGLALSLGGGEVSMQELITLYAMLANGGILQPLVGELLPSSLGKNDMLPRKKLRLLSEESSFMIMDILAQNPRPNQSLSEKRSSLPVYWKTGTSWGFRDAWSVGVFGPYALAVWVGNFDGKGNQSFTGQTAAAPLFFQIIDSMQAQYPNLEQRKIPVPPNVKKVDICLASGNLVTQWCQQKGQTWFIPGKTPIAVDTVFRPVMIDIKTGKTACPPFDPKTSKIEIFEFWSSDLLKLFAQAGIPKRTPPSTKHCTQQSISNAYREIYISSPSENLTYTLQRSALETQFIPLNVTVDAEIQTVYWFANKDYIGKTSAKSPLEWYPKKRGDYIIRAVDDKGNSDQKHIKIAIIQ